jgi:membrane-bound inhibitor of C-type lysozyme
MKTSTLLGVLLILVAILLAWYELVLVPMAHTTAAPASSPAVSYFCDEGVLQVTYASSSVSVTFPDGRTVLLQQTMSGSGTRYEASGTVFWSKGDDAFVTVGDTTPYNNCVAGSVATSGGNSTYTDQEKTFSFSYPAQFTLSGGGIGYTQSWMQNAMTSGMLLAKVSVPASLQPNTNFASSQFTVGVSSDPSALATCLTQTNPSNASSTQVTLNGTPFTKVTYGDAGTGNFYDITSYRIVHGGACYAIEYVIHSLNIGNFPPSRGIREFDKTQVQNMFESMAQSFRFLQ